MKWFEWPEAMLLSHLIHTWTDIQSVLTRKLKLAGKVKATQGPTKQRWFDTINVDLRALRL